MAASLAALLLPPDEDDGGEDLQSAARLERARRILEAIKSDDAEALAEALDEGELAEEDDLALEE